MYSKGPIAPSGAGPGVNCEGSSPEPAVRVRRLAGASAGSRKGGPHRAAMQRRGITFHPSTTNVTDDDSGSPPRTASRLALACCVCARTLRRFVTSHAPMTGEGEMEDAIDGDLRALQFG